MMPADISIDEEWLKKFIDDRLSQFGLIPSCESERKWKCGLTERQVDHICYQIGDWYLMMKPLLEGQHNLGYMKEKLKEMICGTGEE